MTYANHCCLRILYLVHKQQERSNLHFISGSSPKSRSSYVTWSLQMNVTPQPSIMEQKGYTGSPKSIYYICSYHFIDDSRRSSPDIFHTPITARNAKRHACERDSFLDLSVPPNHSHLTSFPSPSSASPPPY